MSARSLLSWVLVAGVIAGAGCASEVGPRHDGSDSASARDESESDIIQPRDVPAIDSIEVVQNDAESGFDSEVGTDALDVGAAESSPCVFPGFDADLGGSTGGGPCVSHSTEHCSNLFAAMTTMNGTVFGGCDPYTASTLDCRPFTNCVSMTHFQNISVTEFISCCGNETACRCDQICISRDGEIPHCVPAGP